jgi:hypothetical protein
MISSDFSKSHLEMRRKNNSSKNLKYFKAKREKKKAKNG